MYYLDKFSGSLFCTEAMGMHDLNTYWEKETRVRYSKLRIKVNHTLKSCGEKIIHMMLATLNAENYT